MYNDIINIITEQNIQLSSLNDEELSQFSEHCYNIITQFTNITIEKFIEEFYNIISQIINQEEKDIQEEKKLDEIELNMQKKYYNYLNELENEHLKSLEHIRNLKKEYAHIKVKLLAKKYQPEQRSKDWYDMRFNMVTASDIGAILGLSKYTTPNDIIIKKCGLTSFKGNKFTWHGQKYEPIATSIYESRFGVTVNEFGLLQHETIPIIGASPDGITDEGIMIEIKCPYTRTIDGNIMAKNMLQYYAQIQVQLEVCDLEECHFWECKFDVSGYHDLKSYKEDKYIPENVKFLNILPLKERSLDYITVPDNRRSSNGQEKGIIAKIKKNISDSEWSWIYPPFMFDTDKQIKWLENEQNKHNYDLFELIFWKLELSSNLIVKRDKKWFANGVPKILALWEQVKLRRKIGCDDLLPKKKSKNILDLSNSSMKKYKKKKNKCMIESDSD